MAVAVAAVAVAVAYDAISIAYSRAARAVSSRSCSASVLSLVLFQKHELRFFQLFLLMIVRADVYVCGMYRSSLIECLDKIGDGLFQ